MPVLTPLQKALFFVALSLATFMMVLDYSIANVSIPYIAGDLAASTDQGTYVITSFAVGNAIGLAMTGWLAKRVGEIRLISISIALFTFFSWTCGLSVNLDMLIINRFIQGFVSGPMVPLSQALVIRFGTPESRSRDLSIWSTIVITAPVIGPLLGGYISDWYSWPWIFYINIPVGIFCVIAIWTMRPYESKIEKIRSDLIGILLLALGVSCLQIFLDKGQQWDWMNSELIIALSIGAIVSFTYLIIRELWYSPPFLDLALFSIPSFTLAIICLFFSYGMYFGSVVLIPLWLQEFMGCNAEWAGIAVCSLGIAPILLSTSVTPFMINHFGPVKTIITSFLFFSAASFYNVIFTVQVDIFHVALGRFFFGFGFVCYIAPLLSLSIQQISPSRIAGATGIFHFVRAMTGAMGTSIFTTLWQRRTIFHHERLAEVLTPFNPMLPPLPDQPLLALLNEALDQQAAMLAINECFYLMGWLFFGLILLLVVYLFFRKKPAQTQGPVQIVVD